MPRDLAFRDSDEVARGGFMNMHRPHATGQTVVITPLTRQVTASDRRAFLKRVAKRRAKKGYK